LSQSFVFGVFCSIYEAYNERATRAREVLEEVASYPTYLCYVREADNSDIPSKNLSTSSPVLYRYVDALTVPAG
jgi:hypothetical protein